MIFRSNRWIKNLTFDINNSLEIAKEFNISEKTAALIIQLGLESKNEIRMFLEAKIENLHDPFLLKDMDKLISHINYMLENRLKVCIYGDYDVDGISSVSILLKYFRYIGLDAMYYIPDRMEEGYGLNVDAITDIKNHGADTIISVDCGISSVKEADHARHIGINLFITDHHECQEELPICNGIINPKQSDCRFPFKSLAGAGIAFKIVQAHSGENFKSIYKNYIDMSAIGTIADITPLIDENRIIAKNGLLSIEESENQGIKALLKVAGLDEKEINAGHIGFNIGPRLNASGRIGTPRLGVQLLTEIDCEKCNEIAEALNALNLERQEMEKEILNQCILNIELSGYNYDDIIIAEGEGWHSGVIGIVASRISERYYKPVVILSLDGENAKGSARSVGKFDIFSAMSSCKDLFDKFGGHKMAAGLSLKSKNIDEFRKRINQYAAKNMDAEDKIPGINIGAELLSKDISHNFLDELEILKPHGFGNPKPVFMYKNLQVDSVRFVGKDGKHFKGVFHDEFRTYDAIKFNCEDIYREITSKNKVDLAFNIEKNNFRGVETIQFNIKDVFIKEHVHRSFSKEFLFSYVDSLFKGKFYNREMFPKSKTEKELFINLKSIIDAKKTFTVYAGSINALMLLEEFLSDNNYFNYVCRFGENLDKDSDKDISEIIVNPFEIKESYGQNNDSILVFDMNSRIIPENAFKNGEVYFSRNYNIELRKISEEFKISKESYSRIYKNILNYKMKRFDIGQIAKDTSMSEVQVYFSIMVFLERNLIDVTMESSNIFFKFPVAHKEKVNLLDSKLIKVFQ